MTISQILNNDPIIKSPLLIKISKFKNTKNYDSILVVSHFKGHGMGGYGGALKQLSIGFGSTRGKTYQHTAGVTDDQNLFFKNDLFMENLCYSGYRMIYRSLKDE